MLLVLGLAVWGDVLKEMDCVNINGLPTWTRAAPAWSSGTLTPRVSLSPVDSAPLRLGDLKAAEAFIDSAEVVVVGFFEVRRTQDLWGRGVGVGWGGVQDKGR